MRVFADLQELKKMIHWVQGSISSLDFSPQEMRQMEVAMEEALVNIIEHAHLTEKDQIELVCHVTEETVTFEIKDQGIPFNPLSSFKALDLQKPLEERKEGGLGLFMMRRFMDNLSYERQGEYNILRLQKKRNQ